MAAWNKGVIVEHRQWSPKLHSLFVESDIEPFQAGQFVKIGLELEGKIVGRPYSLCNAPEARPLEIYYIEVPDGELTPALSRRVAGDELLVAPRANGFMILDEVPAGRHLWMMATGTGVGPFLSILDTAEPWLRFERVVLVYAVRTLSELSHEQRIAIVQQKHGKQFVFIPFVSRETVSAGIVLSAADSQVMLCGNPQMIEDTMQILIDRGLRKHRRKEPGQITVEHYW
jgi:ferredoxin--NADP+ reductase